MSKRKRAVTRTAWHRAGLVRPVQRALRERVGALAGVVALGGPRCWWRLWTRGRVVRVWLADGRRARLSLVLCADTGVNVLDLGRRAQREVCSIIEENTHWAVDAVDVFITPKP